MPEPRGVMWTSGEEQALLNLQDSTSTFRVEWDTIAKHPELAGRTVNQIKSKWKNMCARGLNNNTSRQRRFGRWTKEEEQPLLDLLLKRSNTTCTRTTGCHSMIDWDCVIATCPALADRTVDQVKEKWKAVKKKDGARVHGIRSAHWSPAEDARVLELYARITEVGSVSVSQRIRLVAQMQEQASHAQAQAQQQQQQSQSQQEQPQQEHEQQQPLQPLTYPQQEEENHTTQTRPAFESEAGADPGTTTTATTSRVPIAVQLQSQSQQSSSEQPPPPPTQQEPQLDAKRDAEAEAEAASFLITTRTETQRIVDVNINTNVATGAVIAHKEEIVHVPQLQLDRKRLSSKGFRNHRERARSRGDDGGVDVDTDGASHPSDQHADTLNRASYNANAVRLAKKRRLPNIMIDQHMNNYITGSDDHSSSHNNVATVNEAGSSISTSTSSSKRRLSNQPTPTLPRQGRCVVKTTRPTGTGTSRMASKRDQHQHQHHSSSWASLCPKLNEEKVNAIISWPLFDD
jgi:hypothetical protein